jgi:hypothetical protein
MALQTLPPAPTSTPLLEKDGTLSAAWVRWFQQLLTVVQALQAS